MTRRRHKFWKRQVSAEEELSTSLLPITLACGPYDRTRALADGRVEVAGADLRYLTLDPEEIFYRMVTHGEFDVSELSLASYLVIRDKGRRDLPDHARDRDPPRGVRGQPVARP